MGTQRAKKQSNWNLPNVLTSLRIIAIPVFAWLVLRGDDQHTAWMWWSFIVFAALMITDKLDGDIARARGIVTDFGKIADPIADKALMSAALICLNITNALPWWVTIVILIRELGITIWRMFQLKSGHVVPASKGGKIKTTLQALAVSLYLIPLPHWLDIPVFMVMLAAVAVTVWTGIQYLLDSQQAQRDAKSKRNLQ
ncbi:CDP-diacylglycerol--glycerol-3-phosphate 3-phosphatidyltransferase [Corynebacterium gerontici]|uniref:CDP-diacylglycerol--glycerol-3-phosphate 3-phosphatidyltransferase n=1 Tax=Corynebacterium gerontici TaxID=2079234 RepID=A0A3G6J0X1_9CORY|nr:CDP-diacylglycerol--glycerol-3-phosphate 3-phosphatidyltransferase [Corynebacterium gerontici]AZA11617.1 Putative CDP-diacylglycerol--glycerol-3-phosphate 3-phosphatidyl-transferase 2 [Corynebacterium gerontici]